MRFIKLFLFFILFIFLSNVANAQMDYQSRHLSADDIQRVKDFKELLYGVDTKSLQETIKELDKSRHPHINLAMKEAMAHAFVDIVQEINVEGLKKKEWLYSMVCLNMAYLQFGGTPGKYGSTTELNRLIRQKLIKYLPPHFLNQPGVVYSLQ